MASTHVTSQWQITLATDVNFASVVEDSGADAVNLTSYTVVAALDPDGTAYIWRVRYTDSNADTSSWSAPFTLTTLAIFFRVTSAGNQRVTSTGALRIRKA